MDHEGMPGFRIKQPPRGGGGGGGGGGGETKCGRWNPTAEQVKLLTDLFRSGLRTPSTDQIQKISSQLSFYGKIESKNVFYWFQNHKARERQKRRRVFVDNEDHIYREDHTHNHNHKTKHDIMYQVVSSEPERVIETLQLFPLNSFESSDKFMLFANKDNATFSYTCGGITEMDHQPPLDLRLSFLNADELWSRHATKPPGGLSTFDFHYWKSNYLILFLIRVMAVYKLGASGTPYLQG